MSREENPYGVISNFEHSLKPFRLLKSSFRNFSLATFCSVYAQPRTLSTIASDLKGINLLQQAKKAELFYLLLEKVDS